MDKQNKISMLKQSSSFVFVSVANYLEKKYPEINVQNFVDELNEETPYYVENLKTGIIELVSLKHIKDENYWFSHLFMNAFSEVIRKQIPEPNLFYNAGNSVYHAQNFLKTAVGIPLLGPQKIITLLQRENNKFNRTKDIVLLKSERGHAVFRAIFHEGIVPSSLGMEWGAGLLRSYIRLSGATGVEVSHKWIESGPKKPSDKGRGICEFEVRYKDPGVFRRLLKSIIFQIPIVKKEIDYATEIQAEHKEQIINRERIIKEKTDALEKANEKLLELDRLKTEFYTNITHELRTPLTLIKSQVEAIIQGHFGHLIKKSSNIFNSVNRNANLLSKLINNFLDFSKIESGKMNISLEKIDVSNFFKYIISNIESAAHSKNLTCEFIDETQDLDIHLDQNLFEKAIYNLLSNAIKFTPSGGHIDLILDEDENNILISVKDTGIGIAGENQEMIFERFRQIDSSSNRKYEGTGIGLSLTKEIVHLHKGEIKVTSSPDRGSTFTIILPKDIGVMSQKATNGNKPIELLGMTQPHFLDKKLSVIKSEDDAKSHTKNSSFTVLIVEDNNDLCSFLKSIIILKHNVYTAKNGIEALSELKHQEVDLVVSDIMMPEMDGLELLKNIRLNKELSWLPVIMLTARADFPMKMMGFSHGANDYIIKPFQPDELLARIHSQLSLVSLRREYKLSLKNTNEKKLTDKTIVAIEKVKNYIQSNYSDSISRENLASVVDMSSDHLSRMFKKHTGKKISDFVNELRVESILGELESSGRKIVDIAFEAGFENLSSFNRVFKKIKGMTPSEYRKKKMR